MTPHTERARRRSQLAFPWDASRDPALHESVPVPLTTTSRSVVLCGSFRRDPTLLRREFEELRALGCTVLSPLNVDIDREIDGFVFMRGETGFTPDAIEDRHLRAIEAAEFVWLHAPDGYVGLSAALEVGFARSAGVPVFSSQRVRDQTVGHFVTTVESPAAVVTALRGGMVVPPTSMRAFQYYYRRAAIRRGYVGEGALECVLLMLEEVGELARAIRKERNIARHHGSQNSVASEELADVFLYVIHMANTLGVDLADVVRTKDLRNEHRFLERVAGHGKRR